MSKTLNDAKESIGQFIGEARCCAACELGFAAMLTTFSVLLAVQEAVSGAGKNDTELIAAFVGLMPLKS